MSTNEYSIAFSEVLEVLQHSEIEVLEKVPLEIIKKIKEKSCKEYVPKIDEDYKFNISKKAKSILAVIYQDFLCDDDEAEEFRQQILENEKEQQKELRQKYNPDDVFKNYKTVSEKLEMVEYKESIFKKILNKVKIFFARNK